MRKDSGKRLFNSVFISVLVIASVVFLRAAGVSTAVDRFFWEARFSVDKRPVTGQILFVDIDAKSLNELGVWPLPRRNYARLTDYLAGAGAQDILFDVDFSSVSNPADDQLFATAIEKAGNVSLAVFRQAASAENPAKEVINQPIDLFLASAWPVVVMVPVEADSRIWRNLYGYEIAGETEISAAALLGEHTGDTSGAFGLDYSIAIDQLKRVSLIDVLNGSVNAEIFEGKKVIVGASALELRDLFPTPVHDMLPGSLIQALGAETLMQNRAMHVEGEVAVLAFAFAIFALLMMTKIEGWAIKIAILALAAGAIELVAFLAQKSQPVLVPTASAHIFLLFAAASVILRELGFHKLISHLATVSQRNSERMLGLVFDDSFDAIVVVRQDGCVSAASQMARTLFNCQKPVGKQAQEVLPRDLVEEANGALVAPTIVRPVPKILVMPGEDGQNRYIEYVVTRSETTLVRSRWRKEIKSEAVACLTCRDVTDVRESALRLEYLARFDPVTRLLNRNGFVEELARQSASLQGGGDSLCLVQFAIVNLDQIMASLGFSYGDRVRTAIASRLKSHIGEGATWSAVAADVFAGVFQCALDEDDDLKMIETIQQIVGEDYSIDGARISVQLKFGYVFSDGRLTPEVLLKKSGNALAKARRDFRVEAMAFRPEMDAALQRRRKLETELFKAIVRDELHVAYQPLVDLADQSIFGVEALLRWTHRELGPISPGEFVPVAEENGYIVELGAWTLNRAMKEALSWTSPLRLSVNLSPIQFSRGNLTSTIAEALQRTGFPAERLDLEITESLFIDESVDLNFMMEELRSLDCHFSLDDFGTGYSSLGYISKYPFSKIKLDRSFVRDSIADKKDTALIEAVLHLAQGYEMEVLVEGIETPDQASKLRELGCKLGQGYLFGRPMNAAELSALLPKAA